MSSVRQSGNYAGGKYPAKNALDGNPNTFTVSDIQVGGWWEVQFTQPYLIDRVRVLNRKDCCGDRLAGTMVFVDNTMCNSVQGDTRNGQWYTVKCNFPIFGKKIRLRTT
jgi:hypothetical protein